MEFPRFVYRDGGQHLRAGGTYSSLLTNSKEEYYAALADSWYDTILEAIEKFRRLEPIVVDDKAIKEETERESNPMHYTRAELEEAAHAKQIRFHPSIGNKALAEKILAALGPNEGYQVKGL